MIYFNEIDLAIKPKGAAAYSGILADRCSLNISKLLSWNLIIKNWIVLILAPCWYLVLLLMQYNGEFTFSFCVSHLILVFLTSMQSGN